jgi:hypothetical protein
MSILPKPLAEQSEFLWRDIRVVEFLEQLELVAKIEDRQPPVSRDTQGEEPARMQDKPFVGLGSELTFHYQNETAERLS